VFIIIFTEKQKVVKILKSKIALACIAKSWLKYDKVQN